MKRILLPLAFIACWAASALARVSVSVMKKRLLAPILVLALPCAGTGQYRDFSIRKQSLTRLPELYQQNTPPTAMGLWFDGVTVGIIGWEGQSVPRGAQVAIKGRNFVGRGALVVLKHSVLGELTDTIYLIPRTHFDAMPVQMESCVFELPPNVVGIIEIRLWVDGIESNPVWFRVDKGEE